MELLTVDHTLWLNRPGMQMLVLSPNFPLPKGWQKSGWDKRTETVLIMTPDGSYSEGTAEINMTRRSIRGPAPLDEIWHITLWLTDKTPEEVPGGSRILVSPEVKSAILPDSRD